MSKLLKLGLGNTVEENTLIFHGGITSRDSFGRITDLLAAWIKKEHTLNQKTSGDLRVLVQGLLEFAFREGGSSVGHLEIAQENQQLFISLRFENYIVGIEDDIEKKLAQYWLNSEESFLIKKNLYPQDRVEVRFMKKLNLLEWRIIRSLDLSSIKLDAVSFQVYSNEEDTFDSSHSNFIEMGDVQYEDWISEVYKNSLDKNKSGELFHNGESVQGEEEWARIVSNHDEKEIEKRIITFKANAEASSAVGGVNTFVDDKTVLIEKTKQYENFLKNKEKQIQKLNVEKANLQNKIDEMIKANQAGDTKQVQLFRDKAMQMFEMAKGLQEEKQKLEKTVFELKRSNEAAVNGTISGGKTPNETPGLLLQIEELTKKSDRLNRALEAEKQKIKVLSDRAVAAEKEAQSSTPLIADLENKIEVALKTGQQHKKETEAVKQKLVQSNAETNKIKNDLLKANAQIQTLMKRQAG